MRVPRNSHGCPPGRRGVECMVLQCLFDAVVGTVYGGFILREGMF